MITLKGQSMSNLIFKILLLITVLQWGCQRKKQTNIFQLLSEEKTGIRFSNNLSESPEFNILNYLYFYNGGGIAAGDVNNDGLTDLYFTANQLPNKLYLNQGDLRFSDVTEEAGVAGIEGWTTGTSMVDINGDGWLDIYVCQVGDYQGIEGNNLLYINQQDGTFQEAAREYGLDFRGFSTQAAFLDYDMDGDLDMYLMNHSVHNNNTYQDTTIRRNRHPLAGDQLFRNDGENGFVNVTEQAGIYSSELGYGLGIAVSDIDRNGCPDIYIGNDFHENDYLYLNNCDGTFSEVLERAVGHTSQFSMGVDIADINQDGWMDILSLDMKPYREAILKTAEPPNSYDIFQFKRSYGYYYQYPRNALQLNQGLPASPDNLQSIPQFSEVAQISGLDATDWSWAALWADYDLDGKQDLFISNGIYRRPNDMDYINFSSDPKVVRSLKSGIDTQDLAFIEKMPQVKIANRLFTFEETLKYREVSREWGLDQPVFSNGAIYADLDNDGDLELVTNNINEPAYVYENLSDSLTDHHYLKVKLEEDQHNSMSIGARIEAHYGDNVWVREQFPVRGFLSSVEPMIHFGMGKIEILDSLMIYWPDGTLDIREKVATNQLLNIQKSSTNGRKNTLPPTYKPIFESVDSSLGIDFRHKENNFIDFQREPLMPHMLSQEGPALAIGDVNGDGLDDVFVGNGRRYLSELYIQNGDGSFISIQDTLWQSDSAHEDVDAVFFDADNDEDLDLYVVSGGNEFRGPYKPLMDRLYINDGTGNFLREDDRLPEMYENGSCVRPADFDGDGDIDLFVGNRVISGYYGIAPRSFILENDGSGYFTDVTEDIAAPVARAGMVSDACWMDINHDDKLDLIIVGEWMPVTTFIYKKGQFKENTQLAGLGWTSGWWNSIRSADIDNDGDQDLIVGNLGLNSTFEAQRNEPCFLYLNDFDENGSIDPVICYFEDGNRYPFASRDELLAQIVPLKKKFPTYESFAESSIEDIFTAQQLKNADIRYAYTFASSYLENRGDGTFEVHELPREAQIAPVYDILVKDVDKDGNQDLVLGGNFSGVGPNRGVYDASYALFLKGNGLGGFTPVSPRESGLWVKGNVRAIRALRQKENKALLVFGKNGAELQFVRYSDLVD